MTENDLNKLVGLSVTEGIRYCEANGLKVELWNYKATIANIFSPKTIRLWHDAGIIKAWTAGSPWDIKDE